MSQPAPARREQGTEKRPSCGLARVEAIVRDLSIAGIGYCHWKSNYHLARALGGDEDFDILVARKDFGRFTELMSRHDMREADSPTSQHQPGIVHFLGYDRASGRLINVHAHARILTGDHFLKSFALPLEQMLLENVRTELGAQVPTRECEIIVFVLRSMLKRTTLLDLWFGRRLAASSSEEHAWLTDGLDVAVTERHLARYFPGIEARTFAKALHALSENGGGLRRTVLAFRFRWLLRRYLRAGFVARAVLNTLAVGRMIRNRLRGHKHMVLRSGGAVIAFVGPQATGKSTMAKAVCQWLGRELAVGYVHVGKPPPTLVTFLPNRLIPLARRLFKRQRTREVDRELERASDIRVPLLFLIRKLMLAHERRRLLAKVFRRSRNGTICICDRYPSDAPGAVDGRSFREEVIRSTRSRFKQRLMRWEASIYQEMSPPDVVVELEAPVDVAVERNLERRKRDPQDTAYVRERHGMAIKPLFDRCPVVRIATNRAFDETFADVQAAIWRHL
jgi:thymidylate kinase